MIITDTLNSASEEAELLLYTDVDGLWFKGVWLGDNFRSLITSMIQHLQE